MANKKYKLTDGNYWATDGVYDFDQTKTQREINGELSDAVSDLNGAINALGNVYSVIEWELGSINTSTGAETTATTQIRSCYLRLKAGTDITCDTGFEFLVVLFDINTLAIGTNSGWTSSKYTLADDKFVRILFRSTGHTTISDVGFVSPHIHIGAPEVLQDMICVYVEPIAQASRSYTVGQYLILENTFYRVDTAITVDEYLTPGTNIIAGTVASELTRISSIFKTDGMFKKLTDTFTTSASGNANVTAISGANDIIVAVKPPAATAVGFFGRGSNGAWYVHVVDSSGAAITNTNVTLDIYYMSI